MKLHPFMKRILTAACTVLFFHLAQAQHSVVKEAVYRSTAEKLTALIFQIEQNYVDSVNTEQMVDEAIERMLADLDPHSTYIPAREVKQANESLEGNFEGIGIQFNIIKDTITVISPIAGGPSEKLGIAAGDKIVSIDGVNVAGIGIKNEDVTAKLRGPKDTKVTVGIRRTGERKALEYTITRDKIPIYSLDAAYMVSPKIGYIKLNRFAKTTMAEFLEAINKLKKEGMEDLILDLQGNGGGLLDVSKELADQFIAAGKVLVYTEGRNYPRRDYKSTASGSFLRGRLVVMIDEGSASASEIVSGAVQDWDRGLIVGRRSFGKGLVQRPIPLPDGSLVRLTTQKYYTPSGRCIQKPYDHGTEAYNRERYERYENGEMLTLDTTNLAEAEKFFTSNKRVVYGGGGIIPDVFVPLDTTQSSRLNADLVRKGIMNNFAIDYTNTNRKRLLRTYGDVAAYIQGFKDEEWFDAFKAFATKEGITWDDEQYLRSKQLINGRVKALIARNLWDTSAYYQVYNPYWPTYQKAVELLRENTYGSYNLANK
jgi:carboxyl-terminal processing protease